MKKLCSILLTAALLVGLTACGGKDETPDQGTAGDGEVIVELTKPVSLDFWHCLENETQRNTLIDATDAFNSGTGKEMGITVNLAYQGVPDDLAAAVTASIKAGDTPDLTVCESEDMVQYLQTDCVVNLTPYIEDETWGLDLDNYYDAYLEPCRSFAAEGYYTVPFMRSGDCLYYNKTFFEEHGLTPAKTWEEYETLCRAIHDITGKPASGWDEGTRCFTTLMEQYAGGYTDKEGKLVFADRMDAAVDALSWYQGLIREGVLRIPGEDYFFSGPFSNQIVQMYIGSGGEGLWINDKIPKDRFFEWACTPVPQPADGEKAVLNEAWDVAVLDPGTDMEKRFACWVYLKYLQSDEVILDATNDGAFLPYVKSVAESDAWKNTAASAQLAGAASADFFYNFYAFDNGVSNTAGLKSDVAIAMDNILNAGEDVRSTLENLVAAHQ